MHSQSNMAMFCLKKIISQPRVVEKSPFLAWRTLTHNILMSVIFRSHLTPPICLKMPICAIFSTFWESHLKHTPKVEVHREKFNIGNVAQNFFGGFYICWDYVISFSQHFPYCDCLTDNQTQVAEIATEPFNENVIGLCQYQC